MDAARLSVRVFFCVPEMRNPFYVALGPPFILKGSPTGGNADRKGKNGKRIW